MESAKDMVEFQKICRRESIMHNIKEHIKSGYTGYCTKIYDCPDWLQRELEALGYVVEKYGINQDCIQIRWWENGEENA